MTDLAFFVAGFLCCGLLIGAVWAIRFLMAPPPGHHIVIRGGRRIVRRNPKPKQQQLPLGAAGEQ